MKTKWNCFILFLLLVFSALWQWCQVSTNISSKNQLKIINLSAQQLALNIRLCLISKHRQYGIESKKTSVWLVWCGMNWSRAYTSLSFSPHRRRINCVVARCKEKGIVDEGFRVFGLSWWWKKRKIYGFLIFPPLWGHKRLILNANFLFKRQKSNQIVEACWSIINAHLITRQLNTIEQDLRKH